MVPPRPTPAAPPARKAPPARRPHPARAANRRRQRQPRSRAAMSDQHEAEPSAEPYVATATAEDAGAPAPGQPHGRQPLTGNLIIQAITEGHSVVITILAVFAAL